MKKIFITVICIALLTACHSDDKLDKDKDYKRMGMMKKPKKVREKLFDVTDSFGHLIEAERTSNKFYTDAAVDYIFNDSGNLKVVNHYNSRGQLNRKTDYEYNPNGKILLEKTSAANHLYDNPYDHLFPTETRTYKYDDSGRLKKLRYWSIYNGEMTEYEYCYNGSGKKDTIKIYTFKKMKMGDETGNYLVDYDFSVYYYNQDNETKEISYANNHSDSGWVFGNMSFSSLTRTVDKNDTTEIYSYYSSDDTSRLPSEKSVIVTDEQGNQTLFADVSTTNGTATSKYEYKYEFDKYNSWVKKTEYKDGIAKEIIKREIEY